MIVGHHYDVLPSGCWQWKMKSATRGYGRIAHQGRMWRAHRLAWTLAHGPIPPGAVVRHRCDNPGCVNPDHLDLGTQRDNRNDAVVRGRTARGETHGLHRLTKQDVRLIREAVKDRGLSRRFLSRWFGVDRRTIQNVIRRKTWRDV